MPSDITQQQSLGAAVVVFNNKGHVLLVKHAYGPRWYCLPGGAVEHGESPWDAALRELREETGMQGTDPELVGTYFVYPKRPGVRSFFTCASVTGAPRIQDTSEIESIGWFSPNDLQSNIAYSSPRAIADAAQGLRGQIGGVVQRE